MAVTVTTNTLSTRARYLNVSASTANADAKTVILAMANALIDLGWSRYDTAGATAVIGTDDNAGVVLRRACYDNAQSGHFNYLGLRLVGSGTNTYTFHLIQAADWSSTTSMSAFVNAATKGGEFVPYTPNTTGRTDFLNFAQGGTIWLFDSGKTLLITSQSGTSLVRTLGNIWLVGEYKKEFGENVNAATGYIHNGVFTNNKWLLASNGMGGSGSAHVGLTGLSTSTSTAGYYYIGEDFGNYGPNFSGSAPTYWWADSLNHSQFVLTEAPAVSSASSALSRDATAPTTCGTSFTTRVLMGYLGYIGQVTPTYATSVNKVLTGDYTGITGSGTINQNIFGGGAAVPFSTMPLRPTHISSYSWLNSIQEYSPTTLPTALQFNIFEPTLSCGSTNGLATSWTGIQGGTNTYSGPQFKFSMLGRIFDMKIFGPYTSEKYVFLDAMTIPCDTDGFYNAQGTNTDFWLIPSGNHIAFVMPK